MAIYRHCFWILCVFLLSSCTTPVKKNLAKDSEAVIHVVENRSVDASVRRDFKESLELLNAGRYEEAVTLLNEVASQTEGNSAPFINLGIAYSRLDKPTQAENNFLKALSINPDHPVANNEFALFNRKRGQFQEARALFERAVESYPEYLPARKNLGILCDLYLNDASCALDHYRIYHKANPSDEEVKIWITSLEKKMDS
ncbi:tetratricopeptide repeat protein [Aestuariicella sp. G3-2]|uniref:tetratricopeptide repeat protein n=1 Tax=Pseudomaricurvus albidus TaxID=2842452 RepID=UPI001C0B7033|nr:tetratricopeptide repeat protein [Aestuariicella albida]MBU3070268.1 tetratricopeptide repeat protein [Aestuariicella albida]